MSAETWSSTSDHQRTTHNYTSSSDRHHHHPDSVLSLCCTECMWIDTSAVSEPSCVKPQTAQTSLLSCCWLIITVYQCHSPNQRMKTGESQVVFPLGLKPRNNRQFFWKLINLLWSILDEDEACTHISDVCSPHVIQDWRCSVDICYNAKNIWRYYPENVEGVCRVIRKWRINIQRGRSWLKTPLWLSRPKHWVTFTSSVILITEDTSEQIYVPMIWVQMEFRLSSVTLLFPVYLSTNYICESLWSYLWWKVMFL